MFGALFIEAELEEPDRRQHMIFGSTGGSVGQQGSNSGSVTVNHRPNGYYWGKRGMYNFL